MTKKDLIQFLELEDEKEIEELYNKAYELKLVHTGKKVFLRGLIEFSNICVKNCYYCGLRKDNRNVKRYTMTFEEIMESASWAFENGYGSIVLQSGERNDDEFIDFVERIVKSIKKRTENNLRIVLCSGEQSYDVYKRWFDAGADRYLLRIETSNETLYKKIHPEHYSLKERINCLENLNKIGYQVGTGVMIGLPGQTNEDLAGDIEFFKTMDIDMIGMGPYLPHRDTPLIDFDNDKDIKKRLQLGLKMIAITRLYLKNVNIASTTALQAIDPMGRELGLKCGANVIMPNITPQKYREDYQLYDNKPCIDENYIQCKKCIEYRIRSIGEEVAFGETGDPLHYIQRK